MKLGTYFSDFLALLYPNLCIGCEALLPKGSKYICPKCHYNLPKTNTHQIEVPQFREKFEGIVPIRHLLIYCYFQKGGIVQKLLHELKYGNRPEVGEMLGMWYAGDLLQHELGNNFDLIVPVPIHKKRLRQRGYNQSAHFAYGLSGGLGVEVNVQDFVKTKDIDSQTRKSKLRRIQNVTNVFETQDPTVFKGKRLLLVDDVMTTGSTLIACAEALLKASPNCLSVATIGGVK